MTEDLFDDGGVEISHGERGRTFGLSRDTYLRMACTANNCAAIGVEPATIKRLGDGIAGCELVLYGKIGAYSIIVRPPEISLLAVSLDARYIPLQPIFEGKDCDKAWWQVTRVIFEQEGCCLLLTSHDYPE